MCRALLVCCGMLFVSQVIALEVPIVLGNHEFNVLQGNQVSVSLKGRGWTLDPDRSNLDSEGALITLLELQESSDSTKLVFVRDDIGIDTLVFRRSDLRTGELYMYSLVLHWIADSSDISSRYRDDHVLITQMSRIIRSNNSAIQDTNTILTAPKAPTADNDTVEVPEKSNISLSNASNTAKSITGSKTGSAVSPTRNDTSANISSDSTTNTQAKNNLMLDSAGIVHKKDVVQKDEIQRMSKDEFLSSLDTLWNRNRQKGEQFALQWISTHNDASSDISAEGYFALAQKFEKNPMVSQDILKALQYYTYIVGTYPLSSVYNDARKRIKILQNGYVFVR